MQLVREVPHGRKAHTVTAFLWNMYRKKLRAANALSTVPLSRRLHQHGTSTCGGDERSSVSLKCHQQCLDMRHDCHGAKVHDIGTVTAISTSHGHQSPDSR